MSSFKVGQARACACIKPGGTLLIRATGLQTRQTLLALQAQLVDRYAARTRTFVVDYRAAAMAVSVDDMLALSEVQSAQMPAAVVANEPQMSVMLKCSALLSRRGVTRRVFAQLELAVRWAEAEARLPNL